MTETRFELIGVDTVRPGGGQTARLELAEVGVRVTGRTGSMEEAVRISNKVETLYTNGSARGGGAWKSARQVVAVVSALLPQDLAQPQVLYEVP